MPRLLIGLTGRYPLPDENAYVFRQWRIGIVNRLVLADDAAKFPGD